MPTSLKEGRGKECQGGDGGQHAWLDTKCIFTSCVELAGGGRNNGIGNCIVTQVTRVTIHRISYNILNSEPKIMFFGSLKSL